MMKLMRSGLAVVLSLGVGQSAFAIGGDFIGNEVPSARAAGQGYTGIAGQNDDPTAAYSNPAAITSLRGTQATVGLHWENIHGSYVDNSGSETKERVTNVAVPNFSVTQSFMDGKLAAGLSSQSPYGLETHWDANSPMRYVATNSVLHMVDISPVIAYQVHPKVSVGAGVDYVNLFDAQLDRQVNVDVISAALGGPLTGAPDATGSLKGQAASWAYHAGAVYQPTEQHALGITYRSKVDLRVNGNVTIRGISPTSQMGAVFGAPDYTTSAYTDIVLPSNVQFGYAFKPNDKWMLEADAAWYHWSEDKDLNVRYSETDPTRLLVLNVGNPTPLTLRDAWSFAVGTNYKMSEKWQLRGGFWYEPHAMPETTFTPAFMDLSRYSVSVGCGYAITQSVSIDAAYSAVFFHNRAINNAVQQTNTFIPDGTPLPSGTAGINGTYKDFANLLALNVTYRFGSGK